MAWHIENNITRDQRESYYAMMMEQANARSEDQYKFVCREFCKNDLYFLLLHILNRKEIKSSDKQADFVFNRCREVYNSPNDNIDLWSRGHYKNLDRNTMVPTPSGFKNHGDLKPGDQIYAGDGSICNVVAVTPTLNDPYCYELTFCDGSKIVAGGEHIWVADIQSKKRVGGGYNNTREKWKRVKTTTRGLLIEVNKSKQYSTRTYPKIDVAPAVCGVEQDLILDPYVLGVWLGDGSKGTPTITCGSEDLDDMVSLLGQTGIDTVVRSSGKGKFTVKLGTGIAGKRGSSDVNNALRELGIFNDKRIPEHYLLASIEQRWALLQGLMDTDGSCHKNDSQCIFVSAKDDLAEDVFKLCQSLGLKATKILRMGLYRGERRPFWQIQFRGFAENPPFRLKRKAEKCTNGFGVLNRKIKDIHQVPSVPTNCIQVDSKDGMYLVGKNYIPTHNSTIITEALTIQEILNNPELTFCIFSFNRPIAKGFLRLIKREFETNEKLKTLFPDVLWQTPRTESPKWSENEGITVKRKGNPVEATVEAWGLTDGQPTSRHFNRLIYDDVVTDKSVNTPEMMQKVIDGWRLSLNLVSVEYKVRYIGTRYHANDMYGYLIDEGVATPRLIPATDDGTPTGTPVMWSHELFLQKYREMKEYTASCQLLQNPLVDKVKGFDYKDLKFWRPTELYRLNKYILVDPANEKRKTSDYTSMWCVGLGSDKNYYVIDILRDRLNLTERTNKLMDWILKYSPLKIGYERYGMQADIQHIEYVMETTNFRFHGRLIELGGSTKKSDRIGSLEPLLRARRLYLPEYCFYTNYEGRKQDLVKVFIEEEFNCWPVPKHDDMLDALQRVLHPDLNAQFPPTEPVEENLTQAQRDALIVRGLFDRQVTTMEEGFEGIETL